MLTELSTFQLPIVISSGQQQLTRARMHFKFSLIPNISIEFYFIFSLWLNDTVGDWIATVSMHCNTVDDWIATVSMHFNTVSMHTQWQYRFEWKK